MLLKNNNISPWKHVYTRAQKTGLENEVFRNNAYALRTRPWTVEVSGLVKKPQTLDIGTLMRYRPLEDRVYHH
jgi:sulfoxide reductase catalytic subunit YedY